MSLLGIIGLILLGILLILIELFILPGLSISGIAGMIALAAAVYAGYESYGEPTGHYLLITAIIIFIIMLIIALRSNTWKKLSLTANTEGTAYKYDEQSVQKGDTGITVSRLTPGGKVMINDKLYDAHSEDGLIEPHEAIYVKKLESNQLIVKLKN